MEHEITTVEVIINILFQVINIVIFFLLFIKFIGKPLTEIIHAKIEREKKLAEADSAYTNLMLKAQWEKEVLIAQGKQHKEQILQEAYLLAQKKENDLIAQAKMKAAQLVATAEQSIIWMKQELEENFVSSVKQTSASVVKKLIGSQPLLEDAYLTELAREFSASQK